MVHGVCSPQDIKKKAFARDWPNRSPGGRQPLLKLTPGELDRRPTDRNVRRAGNRKSNPNELLVFLSGLAVSGWTQSGTSQGRPAPESGPDPPGPGRSYHILTWGPMDGF